jgi:uncharacterized repeat protein (TIGR03803 family)
LTGVSAPIQVTFVPYLILQTPPPTQPAQPTSHYVFLTQPASTVEGQSLGTIEVALEDAQDNILTSDDSSVTLEVFPSASIKSIGIIMTPDTVISSSGGIFSPQLLGTTTVPLQNGIATFTDLSVDASGTFVILASANANGFLGSIGPAGASSPFTLSVASRQLVFSSQPANSLPGTTIGSFSVAVEDPFGNVLKTDTSSVTLTAQSALNNPGGSPEVQGTLVRPVQNGFATFDDLSLTSPGFFQFVASDGGTDGVTSNSFIIYTPDATPVPTALPSVGMVAPLGDAELNVHDGLVMDAHGNFYGVTLGFAGSFNSQGAIFEIPAGSSTVEVLASFDSSAPDRSDKLAIDSKGNLYGTTSGGSAGDGTIFELVKGSHTLKTLVTFTGSNGSNPGGYLAIDAADDLFGGTTSGGANNLGTVFELPHGASAVQTLLSFDDENDFSLADGLLLDKQGNLFGVTGDGYGGADSTGALVELAKGSHTLKSLATFSALDGNGFVSPLARDAKGDLFGTMTAGGINDAGTVFELAKGAHVLKAISFGNNEGFPYGGPTIDKSGNVFGDVFDGSRWIYEVKAGSSAITYVAEVSGSTAGEVPTGALTLAPNGTLYGVAVADGQNGAGGIFSLNPASLPVKLFIQKQPAATTANGVVSLKVAVANAKGKIVKNGTFSLTLTLQTGPGSAASGFAPITVDAVNGVATFSDVSLPAVAGTYKFAVSEGTLTPVVTQGVVIRKAAVKVRQH